MIKRVSYVFAYYCPHCVPFSLQNAQKLAEELRVPLRSLNIEIPEQEAEADTLVEEHGDWSEDYLIPQVFIEYEDGRVHHILTGFSEAVSTTKASWDAFFSTSYYTNLIRDQKSGTGTSLKWFINQFLSFKGQCRRHCKEPTSLVELWSEPEKFIGVYVCPGRHVSRVVGFSLNPDTEWFREFLTSQLGQTVVNDRDLRPATRHGWELGGQASTKIGNISSTGSMKEIYWTVYPQTEEEKQRGIFLCSADKKGKRCNKLFVQSITAKNTLCQECRVT